MSSPASPATDGVVRARPIKMARIGYISSAVVLVAFVIVAIVMPHANAGAHFGVKDQVATGVVGLILAGMLFMLTRPRLEADLTSVRMRSFLGGWRTVPWDVVVSVEFPSNVRFARLRLPAEEGFALYAVQRMDREQSVAVMRQLRALFDATHRDPR